MTSSHQKAKTNALRHILTKDHARAAPTPVVTLWPSLVCLAITTGGAIAANSLTVL